MAAAEATELAEGEMAEEEQEANDPRIAAFVAKTQAMSPKTVNTIEWQESSKKKMMPQEAAKHRNTFFTALLVMPRGSNCSATPTYQQIPMFSSNPAIHKGAFSTRTIGNNQRTNHISISHNT